MIEVPTLQEFFFRGEYHITVLVRQGSGKLMERHEKGTFQVIVNLKRWNVVFLS